MKKVFLAGEGPNELGSWAKEPQYRTDEESFPGVLEILLRRVNPSGWEVVDSIHWKHIRKYRASLPGRGDERSVRGAALKAIESGCDVLAFTRDRDGPKYIDRQRAVEKAIHEERKEKADSLQIIGGMAIERLESWLCAICGKSRSEEMGRVRVEEFLKAQGIELKSTAEMVMAVEQADLDKIPEDAASLRQWLDAARSAIGVAGI